MGIVYHGIPQDRALHLAAAHDLKYFVETGTLLGSTAAWAARHFVTVQTVEVSRHYYALATERLRHFNNAFTYCADSAVYLGAIMASLRGPALVWLDAHWSPDLHDKKPEQVCPVLDEVNQIVEDARRHVVMIDDARLFTGEDGWPTVQQIRATFGREWSLDVQDDVIECVPSGMWGIVS